MFLVVMYALFVLPPGQPGKALVGIYGTMQECQDELAVQSSSRPRETFQCLKDTDDLLKPEYRAQHGVTNDKGPSK
jgi:hypothetical protein